MTASFSEILNICRWLAAFLVVIAHVRHLIFVELSLVKHPTLFIKGIYFVTGFGHEAVVIFFVISGYLVGGLTFAKWKASKPDLVPYAAARLSRIYTVYIPALFVGGLLDFIGLHWINASALYTNSLQYHSSMNYEVAATLNAKVFFGNLMMLQGVSVDRFGSNAPLWSLANEWWYYCIFALAGCALLLRGKSRWIYMACAIFIIVCLPVGLTLWFAVWLLGVFVALWSNSQKAIPPPYIGFAALIAALVISRLSHNVDSPSGAAAEYINFLKDFLFGAAFMFFVVSASRMNMALPWPAIQKTLAEFSYTTYLFHFPVMVFIIAAAHQYLGFEIQVQPKSESLAIAVGVVVAIYACCYFAYFLFERHTNSIRRSISEILSR
jgi:peptidoglycan/LPS O-acetylase OafA/YrhL